MRDSLMQTTKSLTGATTVVSAALGLGHDGAQTAVGTPLHLDYELEVSYPANPTGTTPSAKAMIQDTLDGSAWVDRTLLHDTDATTTGYPKNVSTRFVTRPKAKAIRVSWTLFNADNVYGTVTVSLVAGTRRNS